MKWFISDLHLGHEKLLESRGFKDIEAHDNHILDGIKLQVKSEDTLFVLGDVSVAGPRKRECFQRMNEIHCTKYLIGGNHDPGDTGLLTLFDRVHGAYVLGNERWILTHVPVHPQCMGDRFTANLHGHMHRSMIYDDPRYLNLSVEMTGYLPVDLPTVKVLLDRQKQQHTEEGGMA